MWLRGLERYFPAGVRARGASYERRLRVVDSTAVLLHAHVMGSDEYCLRAERQDGSLGVSCSCPYFESSGACKHLWALLLRAQRDGAFADASPVALTELPALSDDHRLTTRAQPPPRREPSAEPAWRRSLAGLREPSRPTTTLAPGAEIAYVLDVKITLLGRGVCLETAQRIRKRDGALSKPLTLNLPASAVAAFPEASDRELVPILSAIGGQSSYSISSDYTPFLATRAMLAGGAAVLLLSKIAATGRLHLRVPVGGKSELVPCRWDDGPPYRFFVVVRPSADAGRLVIRGELRRGDEVRPLGAARFVLADGLACFHDHAARLELGAAGSRWIKLLRTQDGELHVPIEDGEALAVELRSLPGAPHIELPDDLRVEEVRCAAQACLRLESPPRGSFSESLTGLLRFDYGGMVVDELDPRPQVPIPDRRAVLVRDPALEGTARDRLLALGFRRLPSYPDGEKWSLGPKRLGEVAATLAGEGWRVDADDMLFRAPGPIAISVTSGIDWFDLEAKVSYGDAQASLPQLLAAARRGERFVRLDDGSLGLLPEDWLRRHRLIGELGATEGAALRFGKNQIGVLDALLATLPEAQVDKQLARARAALARFDGIEGRSAPRGFVGTLRGYQREGLGWLEFLRDFGFGGCLADDMGLGKTIQVLALLEERRTTRGRSSPSLVVVPKSLIFNWRREAARFTPKLRVLEHHGVGRSLAELSSYDLVVTTYGTMVRDIDALRKVTFDYVILDEAQAIKNPRTESAKAVRVLAGAHRLVLSGTPVENRLADLWSLFEFLNPGMLGASAAFKRYGEADGSDETAGEARALLGRALRPFILRRTKEQVARDLPAKTEQIIYCELEGKERAHYDELRAHYRSTLLGLVDERGIERAQMHILEALLRLRQAACHPGLVDREQAHGPSAKLSALLAQLDDVVQGGHKALVFSQFTSLLAIVRHHLEAANIRFEYLDGRTRNRQARVDRFQADPTCSVFLVSLKAGGVGLNLTAAEYVFLLDPWWNPAVEAQAIDRTHRIGQARPVIAYRLIGRDTIEEKVLALQAQKRGLADAIVNADNAMLSRIGREELDLLLS